MLTAILSLNWILCKSGLVLFFAPYVFLGVRMGGGGILKKTNKQKKTAFSFNMKEVFLSLKFLEYFSSKVHLRLALELYVKYNPCNYLV